MNILFIKYFLVCFMVSEIPIVSVFGHFPLKVILNMTLMMDSAASYNSFNCEYSEYLHNIIFNLDQYKPREAIDIKKK